MHFVSTLWLQLSALRWPIKHKTAEERVNTPKQWVSAAPSTPSNTKSCSISFSPGPQWGEQTGFSKWFLVETNASHQKWCSSYNKYEFLCTLFEEYKTVSCHFPLVRKEEEDNSQCLISCTAISWRIYSGRGIIKKAFETSFLFWRMENVHSPKQVALEVSQGACFQSLFFHVLTWSLPHPANDLG